MSKSTKTQICSDLLEVVRNLKLVLLVGHVWLDLGVGVIDDGQEHVDQHEEDKEHKQHEEDWAKDAIGRLQLLEVEVTEDDTEQGEAAKESRWISSLYTSQYTDISETDIYHYVKPIHNI